MLFVFGSCKKGSPSYRLRYDHRYDGMYTSTRYHSTYYIDSQGIHSESDTTALDSSEVTFGIDSFFFTKYGTYWAYFPRGYNACNPPDYIWCILNKDRYSYYSQYWFNLATYITKEKKIIITYGYNYMGSSWDSTKIVLVKQWICLKKFIIRTDIF